MPIEPHPPRFGPLEDPGFVHQRQPSVGEQASASLASLHRDALRIGAALAAREAPGTRVLLAMPPGPDWYAAFFGCLYARRNAVPVPLLKGGRRLPRIADVVQACAAARALCPLDRAEAAAQLGLRFDPLEDLRAGSSGSAHESPPIVAPEDIAYLQFTSGSTGSANTSTATSASASTEMKWHDQDRPVRAVQRPKPTPRQR